MTQPDPFGLWEAPSTGPAPEVVAFEIPTLDEPSPEAPAAVWRVDLAADGDPLAERAAQVSALEMGVEQAEARLHALLSARQAGLVVSFSGASAVPGGGEAEEKLSLLLDTLEAPVSYGLFDDLGAAVGRAAEQVKEIAGIGEAVERLEAVLNGFNRQFLHYAWVETTTGGLLAARTTVNWVGDMSTYWREGTGRAEQMAHRRSLELALAARAANLKSILAAARLAGSLALAVTTPLGPLRALALGWQFVRDVIQPFLREMKTGM